MQYLLGYAKTVIKGVERVKMTLNIRLWEQNPFLYQDARPRGLRLPSASHEKLGGERLNHMLADTRWAHLWARTQRRSDLAA